AVDGYCDELASAYFKFNARKGQRMAFEVVAQRVGSMLDPVLRLLDARGREVAYVDDVPGIGADARLDHKFPAAGSYVVEVPDTRSQGGTRHRFHMRAGNAPLSKFSFMPVVDASAWKSEQVLPSTAESEPNDTLTAATKITIPTTISGRFQKS